MPTSFFIYLMCAFGTVISLITASYTMDPFDFLYADWVDYLLLAYIGTTLVFVCWWGVMCRVGTAVACFALHPIVAIIASVMAPSPEMYDSLAQVNESNSEVIVIMIIMAIVFLFVFWLGLVLRLIAESIVALGQRHLHI